ncbi:thioredoxin family protein [Desulfocurvus sp.]|jgi:small redox-active disulfide protein 2|uniref:thioredoxin family protein n=1 Tax=Desulfocurvus sp. TaxID=2871698 RepID=UPI0025BE25F3|nr:thioredoxin family protein [Desulfocurvus sp.]MCK9240033.1 thioredoxin family protein [Desulfocurvus sp.]
MREIGILGPGCPRCARLAANVELAVARTGVPCRVERITDMARIAGCGVLLTPALMVDGWLKAVGRVPSVEEIAGLLA